MRPRTKQLVMKIKPAVYWVSTGLTAASMAASAEMYLTRNPQMMRRFKALGYPAYFPTILGVFKVLGVAALLLPGGRLLKEWAYAGFAFTFLGAAGSHAAKEQEKEVAAPLISLAVLVASYLTRPPERRTVQAPHA